MRPPQDEGVLRPSRAGGPFARLPPRETIRLGRTRAGSCGSSPRAGTGSRPARGFRSRESSSSSKGCDEARIPCGECAGVASQPSPVCTRPTPHRTTPRTSQKCALWAAARYRPSLPLFSTGCPSAALDGCAGCCAAPREVRPAGASKATLSLSKGYRQWPRDTTPRISQKCALAFGPRRTRPQRRLARGGAGLVDCYAGCGVASLGCARGRPQPPLT